MSADLRRRVAVALVVALAALMPTISLSSTPTVAAENQWFVADGTPKADAINSTMRSLVESFRWHLFGLSWDGNDHPEMPTHAGFAGTATLDTEWVTGNTVDREGTEATLRSLIEAFRWHFWGIAWDGNPHPEVATHADQVLQAQDLSPWFDPEGAPIPANLTATLQSLVEAFRWHFWGISWDGQLHPEMPTHAPAFGQPARVIAVVDGDTIDVDISRSTHRVRLIGVDTPETYGVVECFGPEASAYATARLQGHSVSLETDVSETDRYDRLLRYV